MTTFLCFQRRKNGFTLVELLVAAAVFMLLVAMLLQLTSSANKTIGHQFRSMEAIGSARVALDTLAQDIGTLVTRGGTTLLFKQGDESANDILRFICISRPVAGTTNSRMTLVSYSLATTNDPVLHADVPMLIRGNAPVKWPDSGDATASDYDFKTVLRDKQLTDSDPAAPRVFRFEIVWLRKDGQITRDPRGLNPDPDANTDANGFVWVDLSEVSGFVVSVISLDGSNQKKVADRSSFAQLQKSFPALQNSESDCGKTPADRWADDIKDAEPALARPNLRIIQRTYYLPK